MKTHMFLTLAVMLTVGCDSTKLNRSNLQKGIDHFLARQQACSGYTEQDFPKVLPSLPGRGDNMLLDALASRGLLSKRLAPVTSSGQLQVEYDLTSDGKKTQFSGANPLNGRLLIFCFGHKEVDTITNFEMPNQNGIVRAFYTWKLADIPGWAKDPAVQATFPNLAGFFRPDPTGNLHKDEIALKATEQGWRVPQDE